MLPAVMYYDPSFEVVFWAPKIGQGDPYTNPKPTLYRLLPYANPKPTENQP